jgi:HSP20 family molecular chaperone IbpA
MSPRRPGIANRSVARMMSDRARAQGAVAPNAAEGAATAQGHGLLDGIRAIAEKLADMAKDGAAQHSGGGERSLDIGGREGRMVFGYTVRMGLDGAEAEPFGHVPPATPQPSGAPAPRRPITDLFEEKAAIVVVVELPGAAEQDITLAVEDGALSVTTTGKHPYAARVDLPAAVEAAGMTRSLRNGILEVRLPRCCKGDGA